jgi:hypothetical protein
MNSAFSTLRGHKVENDKRGVCQKMFILPKDSILMGAYINNFSVVRLRILRTPSFAML